MKNFIKKLIFLVIPIFLTSCDDTKITDIDDKDKFIPESNISYKEHIQPILDVKCSRCHNNTNKSGNVSFENYQSTTSDFRIVFPGNPSASRLYQVLNPYDTKYMPPFPNPPLTEKQKKAVYQWILEGSKNN
ncbi:MAG TPA: hypothetical protein PLP99_06155 [Ignavibacteriales bacterium]|nr:hypothetical protein [Ignavibacteriales bacterium]HOL81324.1 hypothetical protein [Ignavibacteriales bacterium]HOM65440.1 hypothetical protein [Ignavibacteriales bacterium]HPP33907.1 hypothetical protein [Ignavibacteriales bacterium]HRR18462.1 hypothetical protein [Ignavibacteriales bacterium]